MRTVNDEIAAAVEEQTNEIGSVVETLQE